MERRPENYKLCCAEYSSENYDFGFVSDISWETCDAECVFVPPDIRMIDDFAFQFNNKLKAISFSRKSQLEIVGKRAFQQTTIKSVAIPKSIHTICNGCFMASSLQRLTFDEDSQLRSIESNAFAGTSIETVELPSSIRSIGSQCFYYCRSLRILKFGPNCHLTTFETGLFEETSLHTITIPKSVEMIKEKCFYGCRSLTSVEFESGSQLRQIGKQAFSCTGIYEITIPRCTEVLETRCFADCRNLRVFCCESDSSLRRIESAVWFNCSISEFSLPASVSEILTGAFHKIDIENGLKLPESSRFRSLGALIIDKSRRELIGCTFWRTKSISIPAGIEIIGPCCFDGCTRLEEVVIEANSRLREVGDRAFICCPIQELKIPATAETFGRSSLAFRRSEQVVEFASLEQRMRVPKDAFRLLL